MKNESTKAVQRFESMLRAENIRMTEWEYGYTEKDVEEVLPIFQLFIQQQGWKGQIVMVWEQYDECMGMPHGHSNLWMVSEKGAMEMPGVPLMEGTEEEREAFVGALQQFQQPGQKQEKVPFTEERRAGYWNAVAGQGALQTQAD